MQRALRWLIAVTVGVCMFVLAWWLAEAVFRLDRGTAVTLATSAAPFLAAPFAWWASRDPPRSVLAPAVVSTTAGLTGHVFICYSHADDHGYVRRLAAHLTGMGVPVWFDREIITGDRWEQVIRDKIDTCVAVLVVMTPHADASTWVKREITYAEKTRKPILPLLLAGQEFFRLSDLQYEDVTGGRMPGPTFLSQLRTITAETDPAVPVLEPPQVGSGQAPSVPVVAAQPAPVPPVRPSALTGPVAAGPSGSTMDGDQPSEPRPSTPPRSGRWTAVLTVAALLVIVVSVWSIGRQPGSPSAATPATSGPAPSTVSPSASGTAKVLDTFQPTKWFGSEVRPGSCGGWQRLVAVDGEAVE